MTTLRAPRFADFPEEERAVLERVARRMGQSPEELLSTGIWGVQAHWPAWLEANQEEARYAYRWQGSLPRLAKEAIHVAVSMTNNCDY